MLMRIDPPIRSGLARWLMAVTITLAGSGAMNGQLNQETDSVPRVIISTGWADDEYNITITAVDNASNTVSKYFIFL